SRCSSAACARRSAPTASRRCAVWAIASRHSKARPANDPRRGARAAVRRPFLRPRTSLTWRLIWLAAAWSLMALVLTGAVLTTAFRDAALSRLGGVLENTIDEVVAETNGVSGEVVTPQIQDARTLRVYSGKYWAVAEAHGAELAPLRRSESLWDADLPGPPGGLAAVLA